MKSGGSADLALMGGRIPDWLYARMKRLSLAVVEAIVEDYGTTGFLARLSDPFWFQSFGAVIGMDWNSSGVTTAVMRALQDSLNPVSRDLGLHVCGGKGKRSLQTPQQLLRVGDRTGLDGQALARSSKLVAKVDSAAVQDGFNVYQHYFLVSEQGDWTAIQQGMRAADGLARRYHWHSGLVDSFVEEPHAAVTGEILPELLNLTATEAQPTRKGVLEIAADNPDKTLKEVQRLVVSREKGLRPEDVDLKRLGSVLWLAQEVPQGQFEDLLLLKGLGPRTLQSLTLVSEVIHGTPSRFSDPARFTFAHGSKGAKPFPVPTATYDETIDFMRQALDRSKAGQGDKLKAVEKLSKLARRAEQGFTPTESLQAAVDRENRDSWKYGGRTVDGPVQPPKPRQLGLFDDTPPG